MEVAIISCTGLPLHFLHLFSNFIQLVSVLFTPVQLFTFYILWKLFSLATLLFIFLRTNLGVIVYNLHPMLFITHLV